MLKSCSFSVLVWRDLFCYNVFLFFVFFSNPSFFFFFFNLNARQKLQATTAGSSYSLPPSFVEVILITREFLVRDRELNSNRYLKLIRRKFKRKSENSQILLLSKNLDLRDSNLSLQRKVATYTLNVESGWFRTNDGIQSSTEQF